MTKLSERIRERDVNKIRDAYMPYLKEWADEAEALEAELADAYGLLEAAKQHALENSPQEPRPVDKLMQGYEKIGEARALVQPKRYGRRSAFDSAPRPD